MPVPANAPFFQVQFGEFIDDGRAYGVGRPIKELARVHAGAVGLSTMKAVTAGRHIRPEQLKAIARVFQLRPLDWIEVKIRYVEAYLQDYLVRLSGHDVATNSERGDLKTFFARRGLTKRPGLTCQDRFRLFMQAEFSRAKIAPDTIGDSVGASGKRDMHTVSQPTVAAVRRGEHIRPEKFNLICRRLAIGKGRLPIAKILYAESFLGEYLLGEDEAVFTRLNQVNYPRTLDLLIYSTRMTAQLA